MANAVGFAHCVVCQERKGELLINNPTERGKSVLFDALAARKQYEDLKYSSVHLDRISELLQSNHARWHRSCYSDFTSKSHINRLAAKQHVLSSTITESRSGVNVTDTGNTSPAEPCHTSKRLRSSGESLFNETACMFCRQTHANENLIEVQTCVMSASILNDSKMHPVMSVRLSGFIDLIAANGKYHLKCLVFFRREVMKNKTIMNKYSDNAMAWLVSELRYAARFNHYLSNTFVWERFIQLCVQFNQDNSSSKSKKYLLERIHLEMRDVYLFIPSTKENPSSGRETYLVPRKHVDTNAIIDRLNPDDRSIMQFSQPDERFMSMVKVAGILRNDLENLPKRRSIEISERAVVECIPESLNTFMHLLVEGCISEEDSIDGSIETKILNLCQDIVFALRNGEVWTPKHVGLGCTLHQETRSKQLVNLFHDAGNVICYKDILAIDNALALDTLKHVDEETGAVMSQNLTVGKFTHFSADNIDLICSGVSVNSFNATQMAAWQRGPSKFELLDAILVGKYMGKLNIPHSIQNLIPITVSPKINPSFRLPISSGWYSNEDLNTNASILKAQSKDMNFIFKRQSNRSLGWTCFNESQSTVNPPSTEIGYMPIIEAPAHDYDTLNTVVKRCMTLSKKLGQTYTVLTVDQALYYKLMILKWNVPEYRDLLIPRLGGLHIAMNFLKVIGQHTSGIGIETMWLESDILGQNSIKMALEGKQYNRAMRAHKITLQALWVLLLPIFIDHIAEENPNLHEDISRLQGADDSDYTCVTESTAFQQVWSSFCESKKSDPNFTYWIQYIEIVSLLLLFTRSQRDGVWDLYLNSFTKMLPWFMRYDHTNYARWGTVYVAEMRQLPNEVLQEFILGNFVVKGSERQFNQVSPDHSLEWLNAVGKDNGGITGITQNSSALHRWSLTFNIRSRLSAETRSLITKCDCNLIHNEGTPSRIKEDMLTEEKLLVVMKRYNIFAHAEDNDTVMLLQNPVTKDLASEAIQDSLLSASDLGEEQLLSFVQERLIEPVISNFHGPMKKNNPLTMASLYKCTKNSSAKEKHEVIKIDRDILHRLLTAYKAGRNVDMKSILQHELLPVPISLFEMNGNMRGGTKAVLAEELKVGVNCSPTINLYGKSCLVIDGQALVVSIGKPPQAQTFGDLSDAFRNTLLSLAKPYDEVHIVFDRYITHSIKTSTRVKRAKSCFPTRRVIENRNVPLPLKWLDFMSLSKNKEDLARFLATELLENAPENKVIVIGGAFYDPEDVKCNKENVDLQPLRKWHEEGDTRAVLHACLPGYDNVVVMANDTDILVLLLGHINKISATNVWMMTGTKNKRCYIPIREVAAKIPSDAVELIVAFHALTGCDSTSFFYGLSKRGTFKVFRKHYHLLDGLGKQDLNEETLRNVEMFICKAYSLPDHIKTVDIARYHYFSKIKLPEKLPPTSDSLLHHIKRCHYQSMVWYNISTTENHRRLNPEDYGWQIAANELKPVLMSLPAVPKSCQEIIACACKCGCNTMKCSCKKAGMTCTDACTCSDSERSCSNLV